MSIIPPMNAIMVLLQYCCLSWYTFCARFPQVIRLCICCGLMPFNVSPTCFICAGSIFMPVCLPIASNISGDMFPIMSALFFFIGTGLFSYYQAKPEAIAPVKAQVAEMKLLEEKKVSATPESVEARATELTASDIGDKVFPHFIATELPVGVAGLLIAAILAAAMSSIDTSLNSSATVYLSDIHQRHFSPEIDDAGRMKVLHTATIIIGIVGTATALAMLRVKSALDAWWILQGAFSGGMLGLFLLGQISRRANNPNAVIATILGIVLILWLSVSKTKLWPDGWKDFGNPMHGFMTIVVGTSSIVLIGATLARLISGSAASASEEAK